MSLETILIGLCCLLFSICLFLTWKLLQKPVFFDSLEVRQVISDIRDCHQAILKIANKLTTNIGIKSGEVEEENDKAKV